LAREEPAGVLNTGVEGLLCPALGDAANCGADWDTDGRSCPEPAMGNEDGTIVGGRFGRMGER